MVVESLLGASTALSVLGAYFGYKSQKYQNKAQQEQARINFENSILATAEEQNAILQNEADIRNYNMTVSAGGESFEASLDENQRTAGRDISASQTSLALNQDATKRTIRSLRDSTRMARTASLIQMGGAALEGSGSIYAYRENKKLLALKSSKFTPKVGS
tara:strand:+ start:135 stop:617 length:483 start_codon:yes stop_codon:yes gene_type:complete